MSEGIIAGLALGVSFIIRDEQRRVKKDLFAFSLGDAMFEIVFLIITLIPLKFGTTEEDFVGIIH